MCANNSAQDEYFIENKNLLLQVYFTLGRREET